ALSKIETLVPRRWPESPAEKLSSTTQPSRTRLMELVPCATSPSLAPGQVRSHSPTQKSSCFCSAAVQELAGCWAWERLAMRHRARMESAVLNREFIESSSWREGKSPLLAKDARNGAPGVLLYLAQCEVSGTCKS